MNRILLSLVLFLSCVGNALGGTLTQAEVADLRSDLQSLFVAFGNGDPEPIIQRTHSSLVRLVGGQEAFAKITRDAVEGLRAAGVKILSSEIGDPTQTYAAGGEEVCFVPKVTLMSIGEKKARVTSFMIAIRNKGASSWTYLDGAGLAKHPQMLHTLLPALDEHVPLPPNSMEEL